MLPQKFSPAITCSVLPDPGTVEGVPQAARKVERRVIAKRRSVCSLIARFI
jgi:hypothetical protein